jgi:hypothetical protein
VAARPSAASWLSRLREQQPLLFPAPCGGAVFVNRCGDPSGDVGSPIPNWAEQVTAIATAVGALGLLGAFGAVMFAGQQVRESRRSTQAQMAAEFFRRWNDPPLVEARQLVDRLAVKQNLVATFQQSVAEQTPEAYVFYRELDYFEQLAALEHRGAFDFELIKLLLGSALVARWELWAPALEATHGAAVYPMFAKLVSKLRDAVGPAPGDQAGRF